MNSDKRLILISVFSVIFAIGVAFFVLYSPKEKAKEVIIPQDNASHEEKDMSGRLKGISKDEVMIDETEFLVGEEARRMIVADYPECVPEKAADCVPSFNNDFYIRNLEEKTVSFKMADNVKIIAFINPGSPETEEISLDELMARFEDEKSFMKSYPFLFHFKDGLVTVIEERYVP